MGSTTNKNKSCQSHKRTIVGLRYEPITRRPDLPCSALSFLRLLLIVGDFWAYFSLAAGLLPPAMSGFCNCKFWFLIVLSVSTEIECSVLCK
ncbi:hypothetical protein SLEP1_g26121 [Rubroshorea leprosula]|uniref:Uncharacterized protein n=1 Tax=Rubroshorea leprosula TaxID=152421 RepID=A0AAV5JKR2_9ROSI|nr:hypothetical protein SLEP1_g26121 [Rubroshorea leprosula]